MKRTLLSLLAITAISLGVKAQSGIEIYESGQSTNVAGGTVNVTAPDFNVFDVNLEIHNNTGNTATWRITRLRMDVPIGWEDGLCWGHCTDPFGGTCYASDQMGGDNWTSPANVTVLFDIPDGECGKLKPQINPDDFVSGIAHYRYYITTDGILNEDSVDVVVNFTASVKPVKEEPVLSVSPNPANDFVNINVANLDNATLKVVDVLGNVVLRENISGTKKIDLSEFRNGVYFITIDSSNAKPISRKLIVRH